MPCALEPVAYFAQTMHALTVRVQLDQPVVEATRHAPAAVAASTLPQPSPIPQAPTKNFVPLGNHPQDPFRRKATRDVSVAAAAPELPPNNNVQESLSQAVNSEPIE